MKESKVINGVEYKHCGKCDSWLNLSEFSKNRVSKDGLQSKCKKCFKQYQKENKEKIKEYKKEWFQVNKQVITNNQRKYKENKRNNNYLCRLRNNIQASIHQSIRNESITKKSMSYQILKCTYEELKIHLIKSFENIYKIPFSSNYWEYCEIDHILPSSSAQTETELKEIYHFSNTQLIYWEHNRAKSNKVDFSIPEFPSNLITKKQTY